MHLVCQVSAPIVANIATFELPGRLSYFYLASLLEYVASVWDTCLGLLTGQLSTGLLLWSRMLRVLIRLGIWVTVLAAVAGCGNGPSLPDESDLVTRARQAWRDDWHAVWQMEWEGAPIRGPLVVEVWHLADGRLRIETLEAPTPALNGLTLVYDGTTTWLYDLRQNRVEAGTAEQIRIPLASEALEAIDWLLSTIEAMTMIRVSGYDMLASGWAFRLDMSWASDDRAVLWVHQETGLPSRVELHSGTWGDAIFATRSISRFERPHPDLFVLPQPGK
jgi:hypothetical protein